MKCAFPRETASGISYSCKQCMPCRINKRQEWTGKILLESAYERFGSSFVTLTYNEEHAPEDGSLRPDDLRTFLKNLRERTGVGAFRYFAAAEYGDKSWRPHFHLALFGVPFTYQDAIARAWSVQQGQDRQFRFKYRGKYRYLKGWVKIDQLTRERAGYIAGYCTKKLTNAKDPSLNGRHPEFFRVSRRPPLGSAGMHYIRDTFFTDAGSRIIAASGGIPRRFKLGGKSYPYSAYWTKWLQNATGYPMVDIPDETLLPDAIRDEQERQIQAFHDQQRRRFHKRTRAI